MLKVYLVTNYVSINGGEWREVGYGGYQVSDKELHGNIPLNFMSFDSAYEYLSANKVPGISTDISLFKHKPIICVRYTGNYDHTVYRRFSTMAYMATYEEWSDVTLEWIMKNLPASECIQYLKDRGITACPIMK